MYQYTLSVHSIINVQSTLGELMIDLSERQAEIEHECVFDLGVKRYWKEVDGAGQAASPPGQVAIDYTITALRDAINAFVEGAASGKAGRKHTALQYLIHIDASQAAYLTLRYCLDGASENLSMTRIAVSIGRAIQDHVNLLNLSANAPGLYRKVMEQLKSSTAARHRMGVLRHVVKKYQPERLTWTDKHMAILGTKLIELLAESTNFVRVEVAPYRNNKATRAKVKLSESADEFMRLQHEVAELLAPVHLPMIVPPRPWVTPTDGGYLTQAIRKANMIQTHSDGYLEALHDVDMPSVYTSVNAVQATAWRINGPLLDVMVACRDGGPRFASLFVEADAPLPVRPANVPESVPTSELSLDQREVLTAWKRDAAEVYLSNARLANKRVAMSSKFYVASRFREYDAIWFPHYLDFRGRMYPFASYLNPQSDDSGRALLEFAEGKPLGERGLFWLKVHVANLFGVDKVPFAERIEWVDKFMPKLLDSATDPLDGEMFWTTAESPWGALAACMELPGALIAKQDFVSHLPIAMDGSCSGLQHYTAMLRDPHGAAAVNVSPSDRPGDIYSEVAQRAQFIVNDATDDAAKSWQTDKVVRKIAKQPTMTLCYSATIYGMTGQIKTALQNLGGDDYLNGGTVHAASQYLAKVVWDSIGDTVVAARDAMAFLKGIAQLAASENLPIMWTSPSGFPVVQEYRQPEAEVLKVFYGGQRLELYVNRTGSRLDKKKQSAGVAPNFVHSLDAAHLVATVNIGLENDLTSWAMVHDSFGTHACDVDVLNACIREAFVEQYTPDVLQNFSDEVRSQLEATSPELLENFPTVPDKGSLDLESVRDSLYFFA